MAKKKKTGKKKTTVPAGSSAGSKKKTRKKTKRAIDQYDHRDKQRVNIPPVGLVTPDTDPEPAPQQAKKTYQYDPHLDPQLQWAGKAERTSFEIPTVSLHVHERIDPKTIVHAVRAKNGNGNGNGQMPLFAMPEENPPLRDAVDFYKHKHNWTNRLIAGDSLLVMNSLLEKEGLGGQVQMIYIDPPYGIRYGSNFQPFVNKRDVKDGKDEDLTQEPEMLKAFRDTWELGIHSYLTYLRDRLLLARDLLHESGSCFVQISDENLHHVRELMDEVLGAQNFCGIVTFKKTSSASSQILSSVSDYLIWYAKDRARVKYRQLYFRKELGGLGSGQYTWLLDRAGAIRRASKEELADPPQGSRFLRPDQLTSQRPAQEGDVREFHYEGRAFTPGKGTFKSDQRGLESLARAKRLLPIGNTLTYVRYFDDFPAFPCRQRVRSPSR